MQKKVSNSKSELGNAKQNGEVSLETKIRKGKNKQH